MEGRIVRQINLSKAVVSAYLGASEDIYYTLSELIGAVDYEKATQINAPPVSLVDAIPYEIGDDVYEELEAKFDNLDDLSAVAEVLLWSNFFMGATL
jgi:hypothetical protein